MLVLRPNRPFTDTVILWQIHWCWLQRRLVYSLNPTAGIDEGCRLSFSSSSDEPHTPFPAFQPSDSISDAETLIQTFRSQYHGTARLLSAACGLQAHISGLNAYVRGIFGNMQFENARWIRARGMLLPEGPGQPYINAC
jgi:hypothetical protein